MSSSEIIAVESSRKLLEKMRTYVLGLFLPLNGEISREFLYMEWGVGS